MRGAALAGMGGLLVGEGGADEEAGGDSARSSAELQLEKGPPLAQHTHVM